MVPGVERDSAQRPRPQLLALQSAIEALTAGRPSGRPVDAQTLLQLTERARALALRELAEVHPCGPVLPGGAPSTAV